MNADLIMRYCQRMKGSDFVVVPSVQQQFWRVIMEQETDYTNCRLNSQALRVRPADKAEVINRQLQLGRFWKTRF